MPSEYRPLWQTWNLVRVRSNAPLVATADAPVTTNETEPLRFRIQRARIERRWSIAELATHISHCDVVTLAAFERGEEVLTVEMQKQLRKTLGV